MVCCFLSRLTARTPCGARASCGAECRMSSRRSLLASLEPLFMTRPAARSRFTAVPLLFYRPRGLRCPFQDNCTPRVVVYFSGIQSEVADVQHAGLPASSSFYQVLPGQVCFHKATTGSFVLLVLRCRAQHRSQWALYQIQPYVEVFLHTPAQFSGFNYPWISLLCDASSQRAGYSCSAFRCLFQVINWLHACIGCCPRLAIFIHRSCQEHMLA